MFQRFLYVVSHRGFSLNHSRPADAHGNNSMPQHGLSPAAYRIYSRYASLPLPVIYKDALQSPYCCFPGPAPVTSSSSRSLKTGSCEGYPDFSKRHAPYTRPFQTISQQGRSSMPVFPHIQKRQPYFLLGSIRERLNEQIFVTCSLCDVCTA